MKLENIDIISRCSVLGVSEDGKIGAPKKAESFSLGSLVPKTTKLEKFVAVFRW